MRSLLVIVPFLAVTSPSFAQGYSPDIAARKMTLADGFEVTLVASEPVVRQPVCIEFDDRGRLWVVQYLQYPNPAGLKRVKVDRYSRTVYDRIPEPPPNGPKGADRITILDWRAEPRKGPVDVIKNLNLCSGIAFGHGGIFVMQAPYLLFYRLKDDAPDGVPQVLLKGFGMQDAHAVANSLTWGPDGWLYGCQGSTVTSNIPPSPLGGEGRGDGIAFEQGVWRYHPITHKFELFADGGGNSWGLDFDLHGNLLYSTNHGGHVCLHGVQGGYYWKQFDKHGAFRNPFTFGYFGHVAHKNFKGGHVSVGGIVYQGDSFPAKYRGKYFAADLLGHGVYWHNVEPIGSTFKTSHGGDLLLANDTWFAPTDVTLGPDGAIYVADWHDKRMAHPDPDAEWDRTNGRIYRIQAKGAKSTSVPEFHKLPSEKLIDLLAHPNDWIVRRARRVLADRRDPEIILPLRRFITQKKMEPIALQALLALYVSGGFSPEYAETLLDHPNPHIRRWAVRFLGDDQTLTTALTKRLATLAASETDVTVRSQLASSARRFRAEDGLPIVEKLLQHAEDAKDPHLPLLSWWAIEQHARSSPAKIIEHFRTSEAWQSAYTRDVVFRNLMRRCAAAGRDVDMAACTEMLAYGPAQPHRSMLLASFDQGLRDRPGPAAMQAMGSLFTKYASAKAAKDAPREIKFGPELTKQLLVGWKEDITDATLLRLLILADHQPARDRARALAFDEKTSSNVRVRMISLLAPVDLERMLRKAEGEDIRLAALNALAGVDRLETPAALLKHYPDMSPKLRMRTIDVLLARKSWALALLQSVDAGILSSKDIAVEQLRIISVHDDKILTALVRKHWGNVTGGTPEEKLAEMRRHNNDLNAGKGDPSAGKLIYKKLCASCHQLFGDGEKVGPDLTTANRKDRDFLLASIVDPSAVIRREYLSHVITTTDGRTLTGMIVERTPGRLTLINAKAERVSLAPAQVDSLTESPTSVMPEGLLNGLQPQEVRDLFGYLQSALR